MVQASWSGVAAEVTAAAAAGVAPDVVKRYYRNREALFAAAMRLPFDPATSIAQLLAPGIDGLGEQRQRTVNASPGAAR